MAARKRRAGVALALAMLMAACLAGVAHAATHFGTSGYDSIFGTSDEDTIYGLGGEDYLVGAGALYPSWGSRP